MTSAFGCCPKCGTDYPVGAAFCSRCGQQLGYYPDPAPADTVQGPETSGATPNWSSQPAGQQHMPIGNNQPQMQMEWGRAPSKSWLSRYWWVLVAAGVFVFVVIPVLAAIAIPTVFGQQQEAQDSAARSLVRNAMTVVESSYTDDQDLTNLTPATLRAIEPNISWPEDFAANAGSSPASVHASKNQVAVSIDDAGKYEIGTISESGKEFGVVVDKSANSTTTYYRDGQAVDSGRYW